MVHVSAVVVFTVHVHVHTYMYAYSTLFFLRLKASHFI